MTRGKSIVAFYDEFQNLILKVQYIEKWRACLYSFHEVWNKKIFPIITTHMFSSLKNITKVHNVVEGEHKDIKVQKYKGISSLNYWNNNKEVDGAQTSSSWNKNKDLKKPYEGNTPKYPPREENN